MENGVKARLSLGDPNLVSSENQDAFRKIVWNFIQQQQNICRNICSLMCLLYVLHSFLHPEKGNNSGAPNAVSNLLLKLTAALENKLLAVFGTNDTKESICDMIRNQWMAYQNETLPESYYLCQKKPTMPTRGQYSYCKYALEKCGLQQKEIRNSRCKRNDHFWSKVGEIIDNNGRKKYPQLFNLVKCVFSLSHANSVPERGFSINKLLLESHGYSMEGATVECLRQVWDEILRVGEVMKFCV